MMFKSVTNGELNRSSREFDVAGGKGINVSIVLSNIGKTSTCLGYIAGFVGQEIKNKLKAHGCFTDFIELPDGCTRINVKVKEVDGRETEYNGNGPHISENNIQKLLDKINALQKGDLLVLSGSIPEDVPQNIYGQIAQMASKKKIQLVVDAEKNLLSETLSYKPLLIKPNLAELNGILGRNVKTTEDIVAGIDELREKGAQNVLVSMGGQGALFGGSDGSHYRFEAPKGTVINTVGSGDSMVAEFISQYLDNKELSVCARYAVAAGSAGAFSEVLPESDTIGRLYETVKVQDLSK